MSAPLSGSASYALLISVRFSSGPQSWRMCPHHDHVGFRQAVREEVTGGEAKPFLHAVLLDVGLEDPAHFGQVEADAREVLVRERDLHRKIALGRSHVDERLV